MTRPAPAEGAPSSRLAPVALALTAVAHLAALGLPWFTYHSRISSSRLLALLYEARDRPSGWRVKLWGDDLAFELLPVFDTLRLVATAALLVSLVTLARHARGPADVAWRRRAAHRPADAAWRRRAARASGAAFLVTALTIAAVPGDIQFRAYTPSFGAALALAATLSAWIHALPAPARDRRLAVGVAGLVALLAAALWSPWIATARSSGGTYAYETLARTRVSDTGKWARRHYPGDRLRNPALSKLDKHAPYYLGMATGAAGLTLAGLLLAFLGARASFRDEEDAAPRRRRVLVAAGVFAGLGLAFLAAALALVRGPAERWPREGLPLALFAVAAAWWVTRRSTKAAP